MAEAEADCRCVEVVLGSYEEYVLGYSFAKDEDGSYTLKPSFSHHAHDNPVKSVASNNKFLASGSTDETIQLYNMKTRQDFGRLLHHNGTVTSLQFFDSYLFSSSEDSTIGIWSTKTWNCEKTLTGHKDSINDISIHPSGKMALSVSKDKTLRTWNLLKGRPAYITNIKKEADRVQWFPRGSLFLISSGNFVDIYSIETGSVIHTIDAKKRVHSVACVDDDLCAIGEESGQIILHNIKSKKTMLTQTLHSNRIKDIRCFRPEEGNTFLFSVASDGHLKAWELSVSQEGGQLTLLAEVDTGCRPTCMTLVTRAP